jgi:glycosyltransferase involved in cell wall biosynthesis
MFVNSIMEINYRNAVVPWPPNIVRTAMVRPILHENKIAITEPFQGEHITLVNANHNKGVVQFIALADAMPDRKFLGVSAYYGGQADQTLPVPRPKHNNVTWVPFNDDVREILKKTRILLMPSYYESFGRIGIEAMYNGIPVLYSKPAANPTAPNGSSEGLHAWIQPVGIPCEREVLSDWISGVQSLDEETAYLTKSEECRHHIQSMNLFTEASRIADMVEVFTREHPVQIRVSQPLKQSQLKDQPLKEMSAARIPEGSALGFSSGRLRIRR